MTPPDTMTVLVTVTFNDNQLRAHLLPLAEAAEVGGVVLVTDCVTEAEIENVRVIVPPRLLQVAIGRAGAKSVTCAVVARRIRPDWVIGFNLVPHGLNALLAARVSGASAMYHQIGGPREWLGGGWDSDNGVLGRLKRPSRLIERLLLGAVRRFDIVASMGSAGRNVLIENGVDPERAIVLPASVDQGAIDADTAGADTAYDVVCVGALIPVKRTRDLIDAVATLRRDGMLVRTAIAGEGRLRGELERQARAGGVADLVSFLGFRRDVHQLVKSARVFVLTSAYEGLSISLVDAMVAGRAVLASDVGEVRDVVDHGRNGLLYPSGDVPALVAALRRLLTDDMLRAKLGKEARPSALAHASRAVVSGRLISALRAGRYATQGRSLHHARADRRTTA